MRTLKFREERRRILSTQIQDRQPSRQDLLIDTKLSKLLIKFPQKETKHQIIIIDTIIDIYFQRILYYISQPASQPASQEVSNTEEVTNKREE